MVSHQLYEDDTARQMARVLRETDISSAASRAAAYEKAGIPSEQIVAFDAQATAIEHARRASQGGVSGNPADVADETEEDWRL